MAASGACVTFPNTDVVQHSVCSFSKAKSFEIPIYAGDSSQIIALDKPGVVVLGCNIHYWMTGNIVVADTPIAQVVSASGTVVLADLLRGKYALRVWHPLLNGGEVAQEFSVGQFSAAVDVTLQLQPGRKPYKPPLSVKSY